MFDFLFGGKKKIELIRELLEQRMRDLGFNSMEHRLAVKNMGTKQLIGTPEGTMVTIISTVLKMSSKGMLLHHTLDGIEQHRLGSTHDFQEILDLAKGAPDESVAALAAYSFYRINLEHPGRMTVEQFTNAFEQACEALVE